MEVAVWKTPFKIGDLTPDIQRLDDVCNDQVQTRQGNSFELRCMLARL